LIFQLLYSLNVEVPYVGIPIDLLIVAAIIYACYRYQDGTPAIASYSSTSAPQDRGVAEAETSLDALREHDPNFSPILFTDFTYALYAAVHEARGRKELATYSPYLSASARRTLELLGMPGLNRVSGVIVAASRVVKVSNPDRKEVAVVIEFETNYTETTGPLTPTPLPKIGERGRGEGHPTTWYNRERWRVVGGVAGV